MRTVHNGAAAGLDRTAVVVRVTSARGRRLGAPALAAGPVLLSALAVLVHLLPGAGALLEYDRGAILAGQLWRLLTGHWTHTSPDHLLWDVVAFAALGLAVAWRGRRLFWRTVLGSAAAISTALLLLAPEWHTYRGLSGIDSALFVALAVTLLAGERRADRPLGAAALLLFAGKVGFETLTGTALFTTPMPDHQVVPMAHLVGACVGLTIAALDSRPTALRSTPGTRSPARPARRGPARRCPR